MSCGESAFLMDKNLRAVTVRKTFSKPQQLFGRQEVRDIHKVSVHNWSKDGDGMKMVFIFPHNTPSSSYLLQVDGGKPKLTSQKEYKVPRGQNCADERFLFKWKDQGNGSWRCLQSVVDSSKYLLISDDNKVTLTSDSKAGLFQLRRDDTTKCVEDGEIKGCTCWRQQQKIR